MGTTSITDWCMSCSSIPTVTGRYTMHQTATRTCRAPHGALVRLARSAGKLARFVLRGEAYREVRFLPGGRVTREPILRAICFPPILLLIASELDANLTVILIMVPSSYGSGRRDPCSDATKPERGPFRRSLPGL